MAIEIVHDIIHANLSHAPGGQLCGYTTGSADIKWTAADWKAHPGAVRIDQDAAASDFTADVLDVERGAATVADVGNWGLHTLANFKAKTRPGQRYPLIYTIMANVTPVANELVAARLYTGEIGLFLADWDLTQLQAMNDVIHANGPLPIHSVQWQSGQFFDTDIFSVAWLTTVS